MTEEEVLQRDGEEASQGASSEKDRSPEMPMVKEDVVEAVLQALDRGTSVLDVARSYGLDPKTVRAWRSRGEYGKRHHRPAASMLDPYVAWLAARAPEVGFNAVILHRELKEQGFQGSEIIVRRAVRPLRIAALPSRATVRFETAPGEQAQVDFGQTRVWIEEISKDTPVVTQIFVCTLGYSRRSYAVAFPRQRLRDWLSGHEQAFQHFGGVPDRVVVDNAKAMVLTHTRDAVVWHPTYVDFAGYYGFRPWACAPYRPETKGKVESGVKYVKRNALAGRRFLSWSHLNAWLLEWNTTIADLREHGTTHEAPLARFSAEQLTPLGARPPYQWAHVRQRVVANVVHRSARGAIGKPNLRIKDLRHLAALTWLKSDVNIVTISQYLGHSTLSQTMRYVDAHPDEEAAARAAHNVSRNLGL